MTLASWRVLISVKRSIKWRYVHGRGRLILTWKQRMGQYMSPENPIYYVIERHPFDDYDDEDYEGGAVLIKCSMSCLTVPYI